MTSIFSRGYEDILERINSSKRAPVEQVERRQDFSQVLADLEPKALETQEKKAPQELRPAPVSVPQTEPPLSNMSEQERSAGRLRPPEPLLPFGPQPNPNPVNLPTESVKTETPESPEVLSVRWARPNAEHSSSASFQKEELKTMISSAGRYHGVDPQLGYAVAQAESSFRVDAVSQDGHASKGMFQLLDSTAADLMQRFEMKDQDYDPFDPGLNSFLGMGYLRRLHDLFSEDTRLSSKTETTAADSAASLEKLAVAAFNAGEGRVARAQARVESLGGNPADFASVEPHLPKSTQTYVRRVFDFKEVYAASQKDSAIG